MNRFGWMLVKDRFWESYETNRLIEEMIRMQKKQITATEDISGSGAY